MAKIDKALPNVETEIKVPGEEEVAVAQKETVNEQVGPDDVQVTRSFRCNTSSVSRISYTVSSASL
jgi:hypothetical protein